MIYFLLAVIAIETVFLVSSCREKDKGESSIRQAVKEEKKAKKVILKNSPLTR